MEESERYETLSPAETASLRKRSQSALYLLIFVAVTFMGMIAWGVWRASWGTVVAMVIGAILVMWFVFKGHIRDVQSLNRDIRDGKKKVVVARVESQRQDIQATGNNSGVVDDALTSSGPSMSYSYLVKAKGKEFKVSESQYYECKPGQLVELHLAPHSEQVFFLKVLEDVGPE